MCWAQEAVDRQRMFNVGARNLETLLSAKGSTAIVAGVMIAAIGRSLDLIRVGFS